MTDQAVEGKGSQDLLVPLSASDRRVVVVLQGVKAANEQDFSIDSKMNAASSMRPRFFLALRVFVRASILSFINAFKGRE